MQCIFWAHVLYIADRSADDHSTCFVAAYILSIECCRSWIFMILYFVNIYEFSVHAIWAESRNPFHIWRHMAANFCATLYLYRVASKIVSLRQILIINHRNLYFVLPMRLDILIILEWKSSFKKCYTIITWYWIFCAWPNLWHVPVM